MPGVEKLRGFGDQRCSKPLLGRSLPPELPNVQNLQMRFYPGFVSFMGEGHGVGNEVNNRISHGFGHGVNHGDSHGVGHEVSHEVSNGRSWGQSWIQS